jgi:hypothetical protein
LRACFSLKDGQSGAYGIYVTLLKKKAEDDIRREKAFFEILFQKDPGGHPPLRKRSRGIRSTGPLQPFRLQPEDIEGMDITP